MTISSTSPLTTVFGFVSLIKKDLDEIQALHNQHRMSAYPLRKCPSGRPELIYNFPEVYDMFFAYIIPCDQIKYYLYPKLMKEKNKIANVVFYCNVNKVDDFSRTFQAAIPVAVLVLKMQEFIKLIEIY